ncbi:MAG: hypothetical protein IPM71_01965 [Bacteroidota bacterium]|nr:MAG: hypothetical protein IPM71_01965 [Bacteroidota bacterium]
MKRRVDPRYSDITSFEDFRIEKERLMLQSKIIEMNLNFTYLKIRNFFSLSNAFYAIGKEIIMPKISGFINDLLKKDEK